MSILCAIIGVAAVFLILLDTFEAVVLPRRISRPYRFARLYYRVSWRICVTVADRAPTERWRKSWLAAFGPMSLFGLFGTWAAGLIVAFGLIQYAVAPSDRSVFDSFYLSGTTFTTLGYGDVNPSGTAGRLLSIAEALVGFGFLAVVIGFLPVFYQAFSRRELTIALLDARAGSPPSAGEMILRLPPRQGEALDRFLHTAEDWSAGLLESHLSYPVLSYYRSQHDNQSWLATLTCVLDISALVLSVVKGADRQQARLTFAIGRHAVVDLALVHRRPPANPSVDRLSPERLTELLGALKKAGVEVRSEAADLDKLAELRGLYEPFAEALASYLRLDLPRFWCDEGRPDNWQTSAWARRAAGFSRLGSEHVDDHEE